MLRPRQGRSKIRRSKGCDVKLGKRSTTTDSPSASLSESNSTYPVCSVTGPGCPPEARQPLQTTAVPVRRATPQSIGHSYGDVRDRRVGVSNGGQGPSLFHWPSGAARPDQAAGCRFLCAAGGRPRPAPLSAWRVPNPPDSARPRVQRCRPGFPFRLRLPDLPTGRVGRITRTAHQGDGAAGSKPNDNRREKASVVVLLSHTNRLSKVHRHIAPKDCKVGWVSRPIRIRTAFIRDVPSCGFPLTLTPCRQARGPATLGGRRSVCQPSNRSFPRPPTHQPLRIPRASSSPAPAAADFFVAA